MSAFVRFRVGAQGLVSATWSPTCLSASHALRRASTSPIQRFAAAPESADRRDQTGPKLSVDEALFLAKEAGYFTTHEVQRQIVKSPPFSPREQPFLLENFFEVADYAKDDRVEYDDSGEVIDVEESPDLATGSETLVSPVIHGTLRKHFGATDARTFWHSEQEWLEEAEGQGTRKRAVAHAVIRRGSGIIKVNGESDLYALFPHPYMRMEICQPFKLTGTAGCYDVFIQTAGGGPSGKAGATRLAISRALLSARPGCHDDLQRGFCLLEDTRQHYSYQPGRSGRRKGYAWTKR